MFADAVMNLAACVVITGHRGEGRSLGARVAGEVSRSDQQPGQGIDGGIDTRLDRFASGDFVARGPRGQRGGIEWRPMDEFVP